MPPRLRHAFALTPLLPALLVSIANGIMGAGLSAIPLGLLLYVPLAYVLVLLPGYPLVRGLMALGWVSCRAFSLAGLLAGLAMALVLPVLLVGRSATLAEMVTGAYLPLCGVSGGLTGMLLWWLAFAGDRAPTAAAD